MCEHLIQLLSALLHSFQCNVISVTVYRLLVTALHL